MRIAVDRIISAEINPSFVGTHTEKWAAIKNTWQARIDRPDDFVAIWTFVRTLAPEAIRLFLQQWLQEASEAYGGAHSQSCQKGFIERMTTGLRHVPGAEFVTDIFKPADALEAWKHVNARINGIFQGGEDSLIAFLVASQSEVHTIDAIKAVLKAEMAPGLELIAPYSYLKDRNHNLFLIATDEGLDALIATVVDDDNKDEFFAKLNAPRS